MQQRDFLMRQIEQMAQAFATLIRKLLGMKTENTEEEAQLATNELLKDQLSTSIQELLNIPVEAISEFIVKEKGLDESNLEVFADVLVLNAKVKSVHSDQVKLYKIALEVYQWIDNKSRTFSMERQNKIRKIEEFLTK